MDIVGFHGDPNVLKALKHLGTGTHLLGQPQPAAGSFTASSRVEPFCSCTPLAGGAEEAPEVTGGAEPRRDSAWERLTWHMRGPLGRSLNADGLGEAVLGQQPGLKGRKSPDVLQMAPTVSVLQPWPCSRSQLWNPQPRVREYLEILFPGPTGVSPATPLGGLRWVGGARPLGGLGPC